MKQKAASRRELRSHELRLNRGSSGSAVAAWKPQCASFPSCLTPVFDGVFCLQNRQLCSSRPVRASSRALPLIASYNARQLRVLTASTHTQGPVRESETMDRPSKRERFQVAEF